jgi:hypothetical protein
MTVAYRNLDAVVADRMERFRVRRAGQRLEDAAATRVFAARCARSAAGAAGTLAGIAMLVHALGSASFFDHDRTSVNTYALFEAWAAFGIAGAVAWPLARWRARKVLQREPAVSGDTHADVTRIDAADPLRELRSRVMLWETRSTALPLAAASLLVPLTLHLGVATLYSLLFGYDFSASDFSDWIAASAIFVGAAHGALAIQLPLWARSLYRRPTLLLREGIHHTWARILAVTSGVALIPSIFFVTSGNPIVFLPALIVAATGLAFIPFLVVGTAKLITREREIAPEIAPGSGR